MFLQLNAYQTENMFQIYIILKKRERGRETKRPLSLHVILSVITECVYSLCVSVERSSIVHCIVIYK